MIYSNYATLEQVVGLLLCKGAMTMYKNTYGNTPLQVAKDKQSAEWIKRVQVRCVTTGL
jgi:ankyrin repeat protein